MNKLYKYYRSLFATFLLGFLTACASSGLVEEANPLPGASVDETPKDLGAEGVVWSAMSYIEIDNILKNQFDLSENSSARMILADNANLFPGITSSLIARKTIVSVMAEACEETSVSIFQSFDRDAAFLTLLSRKPDNNENEMIDLAIAEVASEKRDFFECVLLASLPETTSLK